MSSIFVEFIHPSWIQILKELHWHCKIDVYLSKGYASFQLTDEERKKWDLSETNINRIKELLQQSIDEYNAKAKKSDLLTLLSFVESVRVPNRLEDVTIINEIRKESDEYNEYVIQQMLPFVEPLISNDQNTLEVLYSNWKGRNIQTIYLKSSSLLVDLLMKRNYFLTFSSINEIKQIKESLLPFYMLLYYYFNKKPTKTRIDIFEYLLLKDEQNLTNILNSIIYRSWKEYSSEMYQLTQKWMESKNPILINWLIHGVENPGRSDALQAFNFLKPAFYINDDEIKFIISHVTATIFCSDPYQCFHIFEDLMSNQNASMVKERLLQSLSDIITDKFVNKNYDDFDFPDLFDVFVKKLEEWKNNNNTLLNNIATVTLKLLEKHDIITF